MLTLACLILGVQCPNAGRAQVLEADLVRAWEFQRNDLNPSDQWPKGWKRRQDRDHPAYLNMKVVPRDPEAVVAALKAQATLSLLWEKITTRSLLAQANPERTPPAIAELLDVVVNRCFEMQMDGASAELIGPIVELDPRYSYGLEAAVQCVGLNGHRVWLEIELLDDNLQVVNTAQTEPLEGNRDWTRVHCVIAQESSERFRAGRVRIMVQRNQDRQFRGIVRIDDIRINRVPRLDLKSNLKLNVAQPGQEFEITCTAIGISGREENPQVRFQMLDELGRVVAQQSVPLVPTSDGPESPPSPSSESSQLVKTKSSTIPKVHVRETSNGQAKWKLRLDSPGHFTARVNLGKHAIRVRDRSMQLAVVDAAELDEPGPFGWSLPDNLNYDQLRSIPQLVRTFGASNIKIPVWLDVNEDAAKIDQIAWLIERLQLHQVQCIGVIDQPPPSQRKQFNDEEQRLPIVTIFQNKAVWEPLLDPILSRMTMKLSWFQLGRDDDYSFLADEQLTKSLADVNASVQSYSQELHLAIPWPWLTPLPQEETLSWDATQLSIAPELRAEELSRYYAGKAHDTTTKWLTLDFLSAKEYSLLDRVRDLTERITMMKRLGVQAAFVTRPMDPDVGLFDSNFEPQPISVPWRTLNQHLGSSSYVGSIALPNHSENHVFQHGNDGYMVLWNESEKDEQLYLGKNIDAIDLWGRPVEVKQAKSPSGATEQSLPVGPWPVIVRGIDLPIARFRMQFELGTASLQSLVGRSQSVPIKAGNPFGKVVRGTMDIFAPTLVEQQRSSEPFQVNPDRTLEKEFPLELRSDVSAGKHAVRFDFQLESDQTDRFSTYHELTVGFEDIEFEWQLQKLSDTQLLLRMVANNRGNDSTTFQCKFFPPPYPYQHFQADNLLPGSTTREFTLQLPKVEAGSEYWIRCEEITTRRVLNYRVRLESAEPKSSAN